MAMRHVLLLVAYLAGHSHIVILVHYLGSSSGGAFKSTTAVFLMELAKVVASAVSLATMRKTKWAELLHWRRIAMNVREMRPTLIPGIIDACINILLVIAIWNLHILIFQISFTLKFVVVSLLEGGWLKRERRVISAISLCLVVSAAILAQFEPLSAFDSVAITHSNPLLGLVLTISVVVLLAINEVHLKRSWCHHHHQHKSFVLLANHHQSGAIEFWNQQLYFGISGALTAALLSPILSEFEGRHSFLHGVSGPLVWWCVVSQAATSLFSAFVLVAFPIYEASLATTVLPFVFIFIFTYAFQLVVHWPIIVATVLVSASSCLSAVVHLCDTGL